MPITIDGSGTVTGISAGGLPDGVITAPDLNGAQTGSAPIYGCRAWVNFDGTRDSTGAVSSANTNRFIRASGNVTSVLRNGAGDYTITFTTAMPDANYAYSLQAQTASAGSSFYGYEAWPSAATASTLRVRFTTNSNGGTATADSSIYCVTVFS